MVRSFLLVAGVPKLATGVGWLSPNEEQIRPYEIRAGGSWLSTEAGAEDVTYIEMKGAPTSPTGCAALPLIRSSQPAG